MWCALWTPSGDAEKLEEMCISNLESDAYDEIFIPKYELKKRYTGSWHLETKDLFNGYVFIVTKDAEKLCGDLKKMPRFNKILRNGNELIQLSDGETEFLENFLRNERTVKMSEGYIIGNKMTATKGPMMNFKGPIKKIDRHKRLATIEVFLFGRDMKINVGLEIVYKIASA